MQFPLKLTGLKKSHSLTQGPGGSKGIAPMCPGSTELDNVGERLIQGSLVCRPRAHFPQVPVALLGAMWESGSRLSSGPRQDQRQTSWISGALSSLLH